MQAILEQGQNCNKALHTAYSVQLLQLLYFKYKFIFWSEGAPKGRSKALDPEGASSRFTAQPM